MKNLVMMMSLAAGLATAGVCSAQAVVGQSAPAFTAMDTTGKEISLAQFKGKFVVLEWMSPDCPYSKGHYASGNMPATQKYAADKGAVWLSVNTSATAGAGPKLSAWMKSQKGMPHAILPDTGTIARAYAAKTTPHMFVIDPHGKLVYAGAIDSKVPTSPEDIKSAKNYVIQALDEATSGKPVSRPVTQPYGCGVKYARAG